MEWLAGSLLVATPLSAGEVFRRSVVLLMHHDEEGAHGLVLNKPLPVGVDPVLPGWNDHLTRPQRLFQGGPVGLDTAVGLVSVKGLDARPPGVHRVFGAIGVVDLDAPPEQIARDALGLRIFAGYSGWGPGQLEGEIGMGAWVVAPMLGHEAFTGRPDELWGWVLRRQPPPYAWLALYPDDPELN